jgi:hypothetical protein
MKNSLHTTCENCGAKDVSLYRWFGERECYCKDCIQKQMDEYYNSSFCTFRDKCSMFDVSEVKYER